MYFVPKGSCLTKRGIEMSEKNGVEGECEDDELRKEAEGAVGAIELPDIGSATNEELEEFVTKVLRCVASLKSVKIDRAHFLRSELKRRCPEINAELAIEKTPIEAGISPQELDRIAAEVIDFETKKCSALSFLAGLPGGVAIAGSITADAAQYFAHVMRIEQKLAYLYGWQSFLDKENEVDDETAGLLIAFLGVVLNVTGVAGTITKITAGVAVDGVAAAIKKQTLTKLPWWKPAKQVIKVLTQKTMTKEVFANAVAKKAVPVAGAFISGGLTYASFKPGAERLRKHLRSLPVSGIDKSEVDGATKMLLMRRSKTLRRRFVRQGLRQFLRASRLVKLWLTAWQLLAALLEREPKRLGVSSKKAPRLQAERLKAVCAWLVKDSVMPQRESVASSVLSERNNHARF